MQWGGSSIATYAQNLYGHSVRRGLEGLFEGERRQTEDYPQSEDVGILQGGGLATNVVIQRTESVAKKNPPVMYFHTDPFFTSSSESEDDKTSSSTREQSLTVSSKSSFVTHINSNACQPKYALETTSHSSLAVRNSEVYCNIGKIAIRAIHEDVPSVCYVKDAFDSSSEKLTYLKSWNKSHATNGAKFIEKDLLLDLDSTAWYLDEPFRTLTEDDRQLQAAIMINHSREQRELCRLCSFDFFEDQANARSASCLLYFPSLSDWHRDVSFINSPIITIINELSTQRVCGFQHSQ